MVKTSIHFAKGSGIRLLYNLENLQLQSINFYENDNSNIDETLKETFQYTCNSIRFIYLGSKITFFILKETKNIYVEENLVTNLGRRICHRQISSPTFLNFFFIKIWRSQLVSIAEELSFI